MQLRCCCFSLLTVLPVRFLYPNLAPSPWRAPLILGALAWLGMMLWLLRDYPTGGSMGGLAVAAVPGVLLLALLLPGGSPPHS